MYGMNGNLLDTDTYIYQFTHTQKKKKIKSPIVKIIPFFLTSLRRFKSLTIN